MRERETLLVHVSQSVCEEITQKAKMPCGAAKTGRKVGSGKREAGDGLPVRAAVVASEWQQRL